MKILFQGDSITDAFRRPEEINPAFQLGNGYAFLVAARLGVEFPRAGLEFVNRGISGNTLRNVADRWDKDTLDAGPDLFSLLIGVNDTLRAVNGGTGGLTDREFESLYASLLTNLRKKNPSVRLILIEPFLLPAGRVTPDWQAHLAPRREAVRRLAVQFDANFLPAQGLYDRALDRAPAAYWSYDGIHPTHAGFALLADAWLEHGRKHINSWLREG